MENQMDLFLDFKAPTALDQDNNHAIPAPDYQLQSQGTRHPLLVLVCRHRSSKSANRHRAHDVTVLLYWILDFASSRRVWDSFLEGSLFSFFTFILLYCVYLSWFISFPSIFSVEERPKRAS